MEIIIEPGSRSRLLAELAEVWRFRGLLGVLVQRDLKVRYKETALGAAWALLQPLALMGVFWLVMGHLLRVPVADVPYPLFAMAGLIPWIFFANAVSASASSLLGASHLIKKVYFPRLIIPLSTLGVALVDFVIGSAMLLAIAAWYGRLGPMAIAALLPLALLVMAAVAVGTLCSALSAIYRDTRYVVPLAMQVWFFATPIVYPATIVDPQLRWVLDLNPLAPLVDAFRGCLLGLAVDGSACARSAAIFAVLLWLATTYFAHVQRRLADSL